MVLFFESHPVQYRAPVYRELQRLRPDKFLVVYASDCSVRGHKDSEFGCDIKWDEPLLSGYSYLVLNNERGVPLSSRRSLHGRGIIGLLLKYKPEAVCFTNFAYEFEWVALLACRLLGIPVWMRMETQDEAVDRSVTKGFLRALVYRVLYAGLDRAFYIGELNRRHLLRHGWPSSRLTRAPYCVVDRWNGLDDAEAGRLGQSWRQRSGIPQDAYVVGFFGKLIAKKDPALILTACSELPTDLQKRIHVVLIGSGEEETALRKKSEHLGFKVHFFGFVNQSLLVDYYLGVDTMVLPSRRMGETWGLVVNEALLAGCSVAVSDAVGSYREFSGWERVRVFKTEDAVGCAAALMQLANCSRDFSWCRERMHSYSIEAAAQGFAKIIR